MSPRVISVRSDQPLAEAMKVLLANGINSAPVLDPAGKLVGMVGLKDGLRAPHASRDEALIHRHTTMTERADAIRQTPVAAVMARAVLTVHADAPIEEAAAIMSNRGRHPLPVLDGGRMVGVISRADVIRAMLREASENVERR